VELIRGLLFGDAIHPSDAFDFWLIKTSVSPFD